MSFLTLLKFIKVLKRCFASAGSVCINPLTPPTGMKHLCDTLVYTSPVNCIPVFNSSIGVKHIFTASNSKWTECHFSGYVHSNSFGQEWFKSCLSTGKELKSSSDLNKNVYLLNNLRSNRGITLFKSYCFTSEMNTVNQKKHHQHKLKKPTSQNTNPSTYTLT